MGLDRRVEKWQATVMVDRFVLCISEEWSVWHWVDRHEITMWQK